MTKNRKKAKKIQVSVPPASAHQRPEPENVSMSSGPVNNSMSDEESGRVHEVASGVNKSKENVITSSETLSKNTDELNKKPGPPESNTEELSQLKNTCRALKSELNTTKKKYEDEKKQKQKLYEENQELKSKVSSFERELQDFKMQLRRFEKESAHHQKSSEEQEQMECEPIKANWWEEQEPEASVDCTREGKEDSWAENNAQGSDTRGPNRRGRDMGQQHNEWRRQQPRRNAEQQPHRNEEQPHGPRNWGRGRGFDNIGDQGQNYRRGWDYRGDHGQNYNRNENNRDRNDHRVRTTDEPSVVTEIVGDLFDAPTDCSLAHCVAEDMRMGSGIAVTFRQKFKRVDELLQQRKGQGNVAVLEDEGRYIYYLVTKRESTGKPTMDTLQKSLETMYKHVVENQVKKLAMPRIGCGLDRLDWDKVKPVIEKIFSKAGAQITIYNYNEGHGKHKPKACSKSGSSERNQNSNYKKSKKKKGKNKNSEKKPEKNSKKGEKKRRN